MPAYLVQCGLSPEVGSWTIAIIGLFNIAGSLLAGYLGGRLPKQLLLATIYFLARRRHRRCSCCSRSPKSRAYIFAAAMGLLWLSTVPLTAGLVSLFFGARYMGMLYGVAFFSHQLGSFVGVWLGGFVYDQHRLLQPGLVSRHPARPRLGRDPPADQRAQRAKLSAQAGLTRRQREPSFPDRS